MSGLELKEYDDMSEIRDNWLTLIREWEATDMTQAEFCRERDVNLATFGMWRSNFIASGECESRAVKTCAVESESKGFIPLKVITDENLSLTAGDKGVADSEMIELSFPHGIILRIPCDARAAV